MFELVRSEYVEANMSTDKKKVTENKHLKNLTWNPNSCLIKIGKQRIRCLIDSGATTYSLVGNFIKH